MWIYLTLSLLLLSGLKADDNSSGSDEENKELKDHVWSLIESKCVKNASTEIKDRSWRWQLYIIFQLETFECRSNLGSTLQETHKKICNEVSDCLYSSVEKVLNKIESCLDSEEKYLPDFILSSYNVTIEEHCKEGADTYATKLYSLEPALENCKQDGRELYNSVVQTCSRELNIVKAMEEGEFVLRKSSLCSDLKILKECAVAIINEQCEDDIVSEIVNGHFEPFLDWCSKHSAENEIDSN